jgi:Uma2 family endonuclease
MCRAKVEEYLAIGVDVVWVVEPERRRVLVYRGGLAPEALGEDDILRGDGLLAGLEIALAELFATE